MKFLFFSSILAGFFFISCSKKAPCNYKAHVAYTDPIGNDIYQSYLRVEIEKRLNSKELLELSDILVGNLPESKNYHFVFMVPAVYKDCPDCPWANCSIDWDGKEYFKTVHYLGTSPEQMDSMKNIKPLKGKLMGHWYVHEPTRETSVLITESDSGSFAEIHRFTGKRPEEHYDGSNVLQKDLYKDMPSYYSSQQDKDNVKFMSLNKKSDSFFISPEDKTLRCLIDKNGDLIYGLEGGRPIIARKY